MTRSHWILAGISCVIAFLSGFGYATILHQAGGQTLPAVSTGIPPSEIIDLTDRDPIEKLLSPNPVVYYQFVEPDGEVRFVRRLAEVPLEWRDRVGFVELAAVPQDTPAGNRMIRKLDSRRDRGEIESD